MREGMHDPTHPGHLSEIAGGVALDLLAVDGPPEVIRSDGSGKVDRPFRHASSLRPCKDRLRQRQ